MSLYDDKCIYCILWLISGLSQGLSKESACQLQETQVRSLGHKDLLEEEMATHSSILAWENTMRSLVGYSHGAARVRHDLVTKQQQTYLMITPISL